MTSLRDRRLPQAGAPHGSTPSGDNDLAFPLLGVFGETGSLLSEVKKKQRDPIAYVGYQASVVEELGDVLWYISALAARAQIGLDELAVNLDRTLTDWQANGSSTITFETIGAQVANVAASPSPAFERTLLALAGEVGLLMTDHNAGRLERESVCAERPAGCHPARASQRGARSWRHTRGRGPRQSRKNL